MSRAVAIIPARGGSKRIPRKNIRYFAGKPLIAYSIAAAQESSVCDRIIVSTDDDEIAEVAVSFGAEVPFKRPAQFSDDFTGTGTVVKHALDWLGAEGEKPDFVCCIYATAPLISAESIASGYQQLVSRPDMQHAFSVGRFSYPVQRSLLREGEGVRMMFPEHAKTRSQDLPEVFHDAGQFYWSRLHSASAEPMFGPKSIAILLPDWRVRDIDTEEDWRHAEILYKVMQAEESSL
ncbi:pseudaminic acid cytidylyltransferase [Pokkaliibacter plantistimulans]|uniref:Pseudaminic acid cytidylyltransferase n=1 Tax=Proteobacteria bacterium 228 TaxID=2083153 RepID=A0A2S5KUN0_9PROT|nr:pseudaminic acid cytidylyltransferase [Pokkaliibacter plantistimulans]PPC78448.1 pseudaminic acid cytidylyltransferase [Pokkaliibacter plantistimulans]